MITSRAGFALLAVLWLLAALSGLMLSVGVPLTLARQAAENRVALTRAEWAAHACLDLYRARRSAGRTLPLGEPVSIGATVSCALDSLRPDERVNPNVTDSAGLARLLVNDTQVASLLDWIDTDGEPRRSGAERVWYTARDREPPRNGPLGDPAELRLVRGFEHLSVAQLEAVFTTRDSGGLSPNRAPRWALETISGLPEGLPAALEAARVSQWFDNAEQTVSALGRQPTIPEFRVMATRFSFSEDRDVLRARGTVDIGRTMVSRTLIATIASDRGRVRVLHLEAR